MKKPEIEEKVAAFHKALDSKFDISLASSINDQLLEHLKIMKTTLEKRILDLVEDAVDEKVNRFKTSLELQCRKIIDSEAKRAGMELHYLDFSSEDAHKCVDQFKQGALMLDEIRAKLSFPLLETWFDEFFHSDRCQKFLAPQLHDFADSIRENIEKKAFGRKATSSKSSKGWDQESKQITQLFSTEKKVSTHSNVNESALNLHNPSSQSLEAQFSQNQLPPMTEVAKQIQKEAPLNPQEQRNYTIGGGETSSRALPPNPVIAEPSWPMMIRQDHFQPIMMQPMFAQPGPSVFAQPGVGFLSLSQQSAPEGSPYYQQPIEEKLTRKYIKKQSSSIPKKKSQKRLEEPQQQPEADLNEKVEGILQPPPRPITKQQRCPQEVQGVGQKRLSPSSSLSDEEHPPIKKKFSKNQNPLDILLKAIEARKSFGGLSEPEQLALKLRQSKTEEAHRNYSQMQAPSQMVDLMVYFTSDIKMKSIEIIIDTRWPTLHDQVAIVADLPFLPNMKGINKDYFSPLLLMPKLLRGGDESTEPVEQDPQEEEDIKQCLVLFQRGSPAQIEIAIDERHYAMQYGFEKQKESVKEKYSICVCEDAQGFNNVLVIGGIDDKGRQNQNYKLRAVLMDQQQSELNNRFTQALDDIQPLPQLNTPRYNCSSFIHRGYLFVAFGQSIPQKKYRSKAGPKTELEMSLEFVLLEDLFEVGKSPVFTSLQVQEPGSDDQSGGEQFLNALVLPDTDDSFYIYGGWQAKRRGTQPHYIYKLKILFNESGVPSEASLLRDNFTLPKPKCSFAQNLPQNKRFVAQIGAWVMLDEDGDLHAFTPGSSPVLISNPLRG